MLGRYALIVPLLFSLAIGAAYAASLPSWDLVDEEQHVHYVQYLVEQHELPVVGTLALSPEIIASLFATDRWGRLGFPRPLSDDPVDMGLEGLSYEAYQPPLFYMALAAPYALLPQAMLDKLYGLRALVVLMAAASVLGSYLLARALWPDEKLLAFGVATLLPLIPERAMAVSRVNNDVLAELAAVGVLVLLARCTRGGLDIRRGLILGLALGLALLTKLNAVALIPAVLVVWGAMYGTIRLWRWLACGGAIALGALAVSGWFFYRNAALYGDWTGIAGFLRIVRFTPRSSPPEVLAALARGFWGMWWDPLIFAFALLGALAFCVAVVGTGRAWSRGLMGREEKIIVLALGAMLTSAVVGVWQGAAGGWVPTLQGRFILPAYAPIVMLTLAGVFRLMPAKTHRKALGSAFVAVAVLNAYVLLYLLPYRYPPS